jgi:large subunit ribosomal protein L17
MKHLHGFRKLNRNASHRKAMLSNMANSMIKHSRVTTTLAKAKELRRVVERLVTKAKVDTLARRRLVLKLLRRPDMLAKLFGVIAPAFAQRPGGYTRIIRFGFRRLDNAEMACIEFVQNFAEERKKPEEKKPGEAGKEALPAAPAAEKPKAAKPAKKEKAEKAEKAVKKEKESKKKG